MAVGRRIRLNGASAGPRAVVALALIALVALTVSCSRDRRDVPADGSGAVVTTPAAPDARAAVVAGSSATVDLPPPPMEGMPQFVGNHGDDLVVAGGVDFDRAGMEIPQDDVAVLDARTFSWRSYARPPFEHPTGYLTAAVAGDHLVISGFSCEIGTRTPDSSGPDCALGPRQTARLDLGSGRWQLLPDPPAPSRSDLGPVGANLFATPSGVLAALPQVRVAVPGAQRAWSFLATGSDEWVRVDAPPFETPLDSCRAGGAVSVITVDVTLDGVTWVPKENTGWGSGERYAHLRAVTWQDATRSWSAPTEPLVTGGVPRLGVACTSTSTVVFTSGHGLPNDTSPAADPDDSGVFVAAAGDTAWTRQAAAPPAVFDAGPSLMASTLPTFSDPPIAVLFDLAGSNGVAYDLTTGSARSWPTPASSFQVTADASILGRPVVVPERAPALAAVVLGP